MPGRHELSDAEWRPVEPHLPPASRGRAWAGHRRTINGVLVRASTGIRWRDLPARPGPRQTVYERSRRWRDDGTRAKLLAALQRSADRAGLVDRSLSCVDGTTARASRAAAGGGKRAAGEPADHPRGRSRGGSSTEPHLVTDGGGRPLAVLATAGRMHESRLPEAAAAAVGVRRAGRGRPRSRPAALAGDEGYSHPRIRRHPGRRGITAVTPRRSDRRPGDRRVRCGRGLYRRRSVAERCVNRPREDRRVATRYEEPATSCRAVVQVACIREWLKRLTTGLSDTP